MASQQTVEFERVPNGNTYEFPPQLISSILLLDGYPELLHLSFGKQDSRLAAWRDGTKSDVIILPIISGFNVAKNCDGKTLCLVEKNQRTGMIISCANGSFTTEEVSFPVSTNIVSFYRVQGTIYVVTWAAPEFHLVSTDLSNPLLKFPYGSMFYMIGNYFITVCPCGPSTTITTHYLNANMAACIRSFEDSFKSIAPLEDRWLIVVGPSCVGILDVLTKELVSFCYTGIVGKIFTCAARKRRNIAELVISASKVAAGVSFNFKTYLPIKGHAGNENQAEIFALEEANAALELENSEVKEKNALLESSVTSLEEDKTVLEAESSRGKNGSS